MTHDLATPPRRRTLTSTSSSTTSPTPATSSGRAQRAAALRTLAGRLGFAVREPRDTLPKGDGFILQVKEVLAQLGVAIRPDHRRPLADNLREAPGRIPAVVDLLASLASRGPSASAARASALGWHTPERKARPCELSSPPGKRQRRRLPLDELLPYETFTVLKQKEHILQCERIELLKDVQRLSEALLAARNSGSLDASWTSNRTNQQASSSRHPAVSVSELQPTTSLLKYEASKQQPVRGEATDVNLQQRSSSSSSITPDHLEDFSCWEAFPRRFTSLPRSTLPCGTKP